MSLPRLWVLAAAAAIGLTGCGADPSQSPPPDHVDDLLTGCEEFESTSVHAEMERGFADSGSAARALARSLDPNRDLALSVVASLSTDERVVWLVMSESDTPWGTISTERVQGRWQGTGATRCVG